MAARTTAYPTAFDSFPGVPDVGNHDPINAVAQATVALEKVVGLVPATASTALTLATATTVYPSGGSVRTISSVNIAAGVTITVTAAGATPGQYLTIAKTATGATGTVTIDGHAFTTHKKFNAQLRFINTAWKMIGYYEYA